MNQAYFNGDFWQCVTATNPGESPATAPAKWRRIAIPKTWRQVLAKLAYANLLELDGQTDKAGIHRTAGESKLDDLVRDAANRETEHNPKQGSAFAPQASQSVSAQTVIEDAERLMRWDLTQLETSEKQDARNAFSMALQQVWEAWWWESLMTFEELALRPTFDFVNQNAIYAPVTSSIVPGGSNPEVYFPPTGKYYQALAPTFGNYAPPATLVNGAYVVNSLFWAESQRCYTGADYVDGTVYALATVVRNPLDGRFYQKLDGVAGTGAGSPDANRSYVMIAQVAQPSTTQYESLTNTLDGAEVFIERDESLLALGFNWTIFTYNPTTEVETFLYNANAPGVTQAENITNWQTTGTIGGQPFVGTLPGPTFTAQGAPPALATLDAAPFWGRLTPWVPNVTYSKPVRHVTRQDPRLTHNPGPFEFQTTTDGILVPCLLCGTVWVTARRVTPVVTGDDFDTTATYEATPQDELVFDS